MTLKNMKKVIYTIIIVSLLSGCAKVTQEGAPCIGARPVLYVADVVIAPQNYYGTATANIVVTYDYLIHWTGPNGFSSIVNNNNQLSLDFSNSSNYGMYTATLVANGCASAIDTFYVRSNLTVPCTITSTNTITTSNGISDQFGYSESFNPGFFNSQDAYIYNNSAGNNDPIIFYYNNSYSGPTAGSSFSLDSTGSFASGQIYGTFTSGGVQYYSVSGTVYCVQNGYSSGFVQLCSARYKSAAGRYITITGSVICSF